MKKTLLIACLLAIALVFTACGNGSNSADSSENTSNDSEILNENNTNRTVQLSSNKQAKYKIIIPEDAAVQVENAAKSLQDKLKSVTGAYFAVSDDYTMSGGAIDSTGEIIIGNCKRNEMQSALATLTYRDYSVSITDANIIIAAHEDSKVSDAVFSFMKFIDDDFVSVDSGSAILSWSGDYSKLYTNYKFDSITIGGVELSKYRIVYPSDTEFEYWLLRNARELQDSIGRRSGYVLPICSDSETESSYEILLGKTNRSESTAYYSSTNAPSNMEYGVTVSNGKLILAGGGWYSVCGAVTGFDAQLAASKDGVLDEINLVKSYMISGNIPSSQGDYRFMSYNVMADLPGYSQNAEIVEAEVRKEIVSELIIKYNPTVVALEEVFENWYEELSEEITEVYNFVPLRTDAGVNRTMLAYNKNEVKLIEYGYVTAEKTPTPNNRVYAWGLFEDLETGMQFITIGCHFSIGDENLRVGEAQGLLQLIDELVTQNNVPVIAMGDFNSVDIGKATQTIKESGKLELAKLNGVDQIWCGNGFSSVASGVEKGNHAQQGSDHYPIWADVTITANNS